MDFNTIKEMEAMFKYVSSNILYICKKIKYFGTWAFVETLNLARIWVKIVYWLYYLTYFYNFKRNYFGFGYF